MEYRRFGNTIVARIDRGEEVLEQVAAIAQAEQIKLASVQALGAVGEFTVGVFHTAEKQYHANSFAGDFEIVSLTGTINTMEMVLVTSDYWNAVHGAEKGEVMQDTEGVEVIEKLGLTKNSFVALAAGKYGAAVKTAGVLRKLLGAQVEGHMDAERYEFCWIVDFPMYEIGEESGELEFCHNPFSMPNGGREILKKAAAGEVDPLSITAFQYDLVCNGVELSSGAVRNHDPEIMIEAFQLVRLGEDDVKAKFPAMYNAFTYGAPPHAGIAPGVDRMVMLLAGEDSIREIIPFPMNKNAQDVMMSAPSEVTQKQLDELHIAIVKPQD